MQLPVLTAPQRRQAGCVDRSVAMLDLGPDLGKVEIIVSGCQSSRLHRELRTKVEALREEGLDRGAMQVRLQSWIDGGSPCDQPLADKCDRLPVEIAMEAEFAHILLGIRTGDWEGDNSAGMVASLRPIESPPPPPSSWAKVRRSSNVWFLFSVLVLLASLGMTVLTVWRLIHPH